MVKRERLRIVKKRDNPEFEKFFKEHASVDKDGKITVRDCYAYLGFNISWNGELISVTYANAVWFLTYGEWPKPGYHIDHINDDSLDNKPKNLQELTEIENHKKRRGRKVYRSYGTGKYGYGLGCYRDKRDNRYYVDRNLSRGHGNGDLKGIRYSLGGYDTLEEAEKTISVHIEEIKIKGLEHIPEQYVAKPKRTSVHLDENYNEMREMRREGKTLQRIADHFGVSITSVYNRTKDI